MNNRAVVDRIEGADLVLLVGEEEREIVVPAHSVPQHILLKQGDWVRVDDSQESLKIIGIDEEFTELARRRIQDKMSQLRARGR